MPSAFATEYTAACDDAHNRPHEKLLLLAESARGTELRCNGNSELLREHRLLDVDAQMLCEALAKPHQFQLLDLSYNHLGLDAASAVSSLLQSDAALESLDLSENGFNEKVPYFKTLCSTQFMQPRKACKRRH
eukprot:6190361-Pleurochrysis_carterae.AAC.1